MLEEILLGEAIQQQTIQHSSIPLSGSASNDLFECTDSNISLEIDQIAYVLQLLNCQIVSINIYNMREIFTKKMQHTQEYLEFSHPITQNGCTFINDNNTPYLLVVTQIGHIFYKNLITNTTNILKNLVVENIKIQCLVQSSVHKDGFQFYFISDTDILYHVTLDVISGEFQKNKYKLNFGTKNFSGFFNCFSQNWRSAFTLNDSQILHFSYISQFYLLELRKTEYQAIQLQCQDNIKTKHVNILQQNQKGKLYVYYQINGQLKLCSINQNQLNIDYIFNLEKINPDNHYYLSILQNHIILIQGFEIYQLNKEKTSFKLITQNQAPVLGHIQSNDKLLLFYNNHVTYMQQISDKISLKQKTLRRQVEKFKNQLRQQLNLIDDEILFQSIKIYPKPENTLNQFQKLIKMIHRNIDQRKIISMMKSQLNNFFTQNFLDDLIREVENIYIFVKPAIKALQLDINLVQKELNDQLEDLNENLNQLFQENYESNDIAIIDEQELRKLAILKSMVVSLLWDYYQMQLEIFLGYGVLSNLTNQKIEFEIEFQQFYNTILLLSLIEDEKLIDIQKILKKQFSKIREQIKLSNLKTFKNALKPYINLIFNDIQKNFAMPDEYFCEQFVHNQINFHSHNVDSKGLIRHFRIAQQTRQIPSDALYFIKNNENQNRELKLKISFTIQKQNPKQDKKQELILNKLIFYAIKLKQYNLLFQTFNLNDVSKCFDSYKIEVDDISLFKCYLNVRTTDKLGEYFLNYSREFHHLQNENKILSYFSYLIKLESKAKAYTLLFEYIVNLESLLVNLKKEEQVSTIRTQLNCINLLINQMKLKSDQDKKPYASQIVCKIKDQIYQQFLNPSTVGDLQQFEQNTQGNIRVINFKQIKFLKQYKEIQYFVCQNYSPQTQLQKVIEQLILNNNFDQLLKIVKMKIDPNYEKNVAFFYLWNKESRQKLINGLSVILKEKELSVILAQICVYCNLKTANCLELYQKAPSQKYFLQYLINIDKEQILQEII
ncbi:unnamed protein product [Paramecium sonneborni]|uniref:Uncharacterized protein n=1 Tax=Paramecium sonneborni TaxID=65129 RepID=A0A8S1MNX2_9CILI|nr:unnamed protein product [Paramecium sonneborni]